MASWDFLKGYVAESDLAYTHSLQIRRKGQQTIIEKSSSKNNKVSPISYPTDKKTPNTTFRSM